VLRENDVIGAPTAAARGVVALLAAPGGAVAVSCLGDTPSSASQCCCTTDVLALPAASSWMAAPASPWLLLDACVPGVSLADARPSADGASFLMFSNELIVTCVHGVAGADKNRICHSHCSDLNPLSVALSPSAPCAGLPLV
jgi:hypothetical protein